MEGLRLKSLREIMQGMTSWISARTTEITDFNPGSVVRTLLEALSLQLEEVYYSMWKNFLWAVENAVFEAFGFTKKLEVKATTDMTIEFRNVLEFNYTIPKGTKFVKSSGDIYYLSTSNVIVLAGAIQATVPVECSKGGVIGNCDSRAITSMITQNNLVLQVYNEEAVINGVEAESKAERKERFTQYLQSLSKGTEDAIIYGALKIDGVVGAWADSSEIGVVKLYVHGPSGSQLSEVKIAEIKESIVNYKSAGVEVVILPVRQVAIPLNVVVTIKEGYDILTYQELVSSATDSYFMNFTVSKNFHISELIKYYMNLDTTAILYVTVINPVADIFVSGQDLIVIGSKSISVETYAR